MKFYKDEKTGRAYFDPDCADEWLMMIWMVGCDYSGMSRAEDLKRLIDELVDMAQKARDCLHDGKLFPDKDAEEEQLTALREEQL